MTNIKQLRYLVSTFQTETHSNSVLDFCTWYENKMEIVNAFRKKPKPTPEQQGDALAKKILKDIDEGN